MVWRHVRVEMTPEDLVGSYMQGIRDFRGIKLIQSRVNGGNKILELPKKLAIKKPTLKRRLFN